jgi:hypothetical protein
MDEFHVIMPSGQKIIVLADHYLFSADGFVVFYDTDNHAVAEFVLNNVAGVVKDDNLVEEDYEY